MPEEQITATDYAFDFKDEIEGGLVRLTLTNEGAEPHQAAVLRLNDGVTQQQFEASLSPDPDNALMITQALGGPNTIGPDTSLTVVDNLESGSYVLLCFVASPDGVSHANKGMYTFFDVTEGPAQEGPKPEADFNVIASDFQFIGNDSLPAGEQTIEVVNAGPQVHELTIMRLEQGATPSDLTAALDNPAGSPPPASPAGGLVAVMPAITGWVEADLDAGNYVFICFVPDPNTGQRHYQLGMIKEFRVQ